MLLPSLLPSLGRSNNGHEGLGQAWLMNGFLKSTGPLGARPSGDAALCGERTMPAPPPGRDEVQPLGKLHIMGCEP